MRIRVLNILLLLVFTIGIFGAGSLVWNEVSQGNVCPKLLGIPACYIILGCFMIPLFSHFFKWKNSIYFVFTGAAFAIALVASILQFIGKGECPKTTNETPMCYFSLGLFLSLIILKLVSEKYVSKIL